MVCAMVSWTIRIWLGSMLGHISQRRTQVTEQQKGWGHTVTSGEKVLEKSYLLVFHLCWPPHLTVGGGGGQGHGFIGSKESQ